MKKYILTLIIITYKSEAQSQRLNRIEKFAYGKTNTNINQQERINHLLKDLGITDDKNEIKKEILTKKESDIDFKDDGNYPVVDRMEEKILKKNNKNLDIYKRLGILENKIFKKENSKLPLNERVDILTQKISPDKITINEDFVDENYSENNSDKFNAKQEDEILTTNEDNVPTLISRELSQLEREILMMDYPNETSDIRIARLETTVFSRMFPTDSDSSRIERLKSAITAQKTSKKYDKNKFMQFATTGLQVGAFLLMILAMIL